MDPSNHIIPSGADTAALEAFVVDNRELEELEDLLASFNLFEAIGVVAQEVKHSNFLAFLLDPSGTHGLGEVFLKRFLKRVLTDAESPPFSPIEWTWPIPVQPKSGANGETSTFSSCVPIAGSCAP